MKAIHEIIERIKKSMWILSNIFQGAESTPVVAGLDAIVKYNGVTIAYATNVSIDEDFELQGIRTLGVHGDRDFKSMGYSATMTVGTFVLVGSSAVPGALPTPTKDTIVTSGLVNFEILSPDITTDGTPVTLYLAQGCKCASKGVNFDSGALATKNTTWRVKNVKPQTVS